MKYQVNRYNEIGDIKETAQIAAATVSKAIEKVFGATEPDYKMQKWYIGGNHRLYRFTHKFSKERIDIYSIIH